MLVSGRVTYIRLFLFTIDAGSPLLVGPGLDWAFEVVLWIKCHESLREGDLTTRERERENGTISIELCL